MASLPPLAANSENPTPIQQALFQAPGQGGPSNIQLAQAAVPPTLVPPPAPGTGSAAAQPPPIVPPQPKIQPGGVLPELTSDILERQFTMVPRSSRTPVMTQEEVPNEPGTKMMVINPGVIITITERKKIDPNVLRTTVLAADHVVIWTKGELKDLTEGLSLGPPGVDRPNAPQASKANQDSQLEFYLSGNVEISNANGKTTTYTYAKEAYYNANTNVALSLDAVMVAKQPALPLPVYLFTPELRKLNEVQYAWDKSNENASLLPYGPGLEVTTTSGTMDDFRAIRKSIFGQTFISPFTGQPEVVEERLVKGYNAVIWLEGIPIFYWPYFQGDANDPLGPLHSLSGGYSKIFGAEVFVSWNFYNLLGIDPGPGTHWYLNTDYMSTRGPALGMDYSADNLGFPGKTLFDVPGKWIINVKWYGNYDTGTDQIGGSRGTEVIFGDPLMPSVEPITHPNWRGRWLSNIDWTEMPNGFSIMGQLAAVSDRNYLDQYFNQDWLNGYDEETFIQVKQQKDDWAWTLYANVNDYNWLTVTQWAPKADGYLIGQDFLEDWFTYTTHVSAGYALFNTTHQQPVAYQPTDFNDTTARLDWINEVDMPFRAGAFTIVPYGILDLTYYSEDINGTGIGRVYGGGGFRASIPFSHLYADVHNELFNLNGIYHKIVLSENFYWAGSNVSHLLLPQLDQLNDNETDQALRDIRPQQFLLNPANAPLLVSNFFDPQFFALRKLVLNEVDTLDAMEVVTLDLRQRLQTKRGIPGQEHIIDWMTLDVQASFFPQPLHQDFNEVVNFIQYDWTWAIGDRTQLFSGGWFDPTPNAARVWNFGVDFNRPDRTNLSLVYRQIDPLNSKLVTVGLNLPFSAKYSFNMSSSYDFGVNTQNNTFTLTRKGTDLTLAFGFSYDTILNNVGVVFELYPNLLPVSPGGANLLGSTLAQGR
jgi:hypothetical protein